MSRVNTSAYALLYTCTISARCFYAFCTTVAALPFLSRARCGVRFGVRSVPGGARACAEFCPGRCKKTWGEVTSTGKPRQQKKRCASDLAALPGVERSMSLTIPRFCEKPAEKSRAKRAKNGAKQYKIRVCGTFAQLR